MRQIQKMIKGKSLLQSKKKSFTVGNTNNNTDRHPNTLNCDTQQASNEFTFRTFPFGGMIFANHARK